MLVLDVEFEAFFEEAKLRMPGERIYLARRSGRTWLTAASGPAGVLLRASTDRSLAQVEESVRVRNVDFAIGQWSADGQLEEFRSFDAVIAGVAYRSEESKPGLWLDAFPDEPSVQEVLTSFYNELTQSGDAGDISFEDFLRLASPNVVILRGEEIRYHLGMKDGSAG